MMKENILISGRLGTGKSTLIKRILEHIPPGAASGFLTEEIRDGYQKVGSRIVTTDGREVKPSFRWRPASSRWSRGFARNGRRWISTG